MNALATNNRPAPVTVFQNHRSLMVKNLRPGLTECGKIKIGVKGEKRPAKGGGEFQLPKKLDHFLVTTLERGRDENFLLDQSIHGRLGEQPKELPVRLLFNDPWLNFQTSYVAFKGKTRFCTGDGEQAERLQSDGKSKTIACPCHLLDPSYTGDDKCKINGTLAVVIDGAPVVGGVWKLRTTSINTCQGIASSLALLASMTGGQIAGIPLTLAIRPKAAVTPSGQSTTVYVVGLEFRGTMDELRKLALDRAMADATFGERMARVEDQARLMIEAPKVGTSDLEHVEEFYPEAAKRAHGVKAGQQPGLDKRAAYLVAGEDNMNDGLLPEQEPRDHDDDGVVIEPDDADPLRILAIASTKEALETLGVALERYKDSADQTAAAALLWKYSDHFRAKGNGAAKTIASYDAWIAEWKPAPGEDGEFGGEGDEAGDAPLPPTSKAMVDAMRAG